MSRKLTALFASRDRVMNAEGSVYAVVDVNKSEEGDPNFPFRYKIVGPEGIFTRHEAELLRDYVLLPHKCKMGFIGNDTHQLKKVYADNQTTESEPYFFTGKAGADHFEAAKTGKDFIAVLMRGKDWEITPDDPNNRWFAADKVNGLDFGSWCRIRAANAEEAKKVANDCEDQHESFHNQDEDWLNIVNTPAAERF